MITTPEQIKQQEAQRAQQQTLVARQNADRERQLADQVESKASTPLGQLDQGKMGDFFKPFMQHPALAKFFEMFTDMLGLEPETAESMQNDVFQDIYTEVTNGELSFTGFPDRVKESIVKAVDKMEASGEITFADGQKEQYITSLNDAVDQFAKDGGSFLNQEGFIQALEVSSASDHLDVLRTPKVDDAVFDYSNPVPAKLDPKSDGTSVLGADGKQLFSFEPDEQGNIPVYSLHGSTTQDVHLDAEYDLTPEEFQAELKSGFTIEAVAHQDFDEDVENAAIIGYHVTNSDGSFSAYVGPESVALEKMVDEKPEIINVDFTRGMKDGLEADAVRDRSPSLEVKAEADRTLEQAQKLEEQRVGMGIGGPSVGLPN